MVLSVPHSTAQERIGSPISITVSTRKVLALQIAGRGTSAAGSVADAVGLQAVATLLQTTHPLIASIGSVASARTLGSLQGSETDASGTQQSWQFTRTEASVLFFLKYKVH